MRNSSTHPLQIAEIPAGDGKGIIGLTFCPGKKQPDSWTGGWDRDLPTDLDAIASWGAAAVISLIERHELHSLKVAELGEAVTERHMTWFNLPVPDVSVPGRDVEKQWASAGEQIRAILRSGFKVLVHCKGGLGRAGMISARLLVELGWDAREAITQVRRVRPGALETPAQQAHVLRCRPIDEPFRPAGQHAVEDRALGSLLGLAVGDALGTTLEFRPRDTLPRVTGLVGGGPFRLLPGEWTDDTSMALALADSLLAHPALNPADLMTRFLSWWRNGYYSCTGTCFDIGSTTRDALSRFEKTGEPLAGSSDPFSAGNGSLMRLAPVVIRGFAHGEVAGESGASLQSRTTHAAAECLDACSQFALILHGAMAGERRSTVLGHSFSAIEPAIAGIMRGSWRGKHRHDVRSSGYVAHSLEAALWCVGRTPSFADAVLLAANLGEDADTTAAITGQLAGAFYGLSAIPEPWLDKLAWRREIEEVGRSLLKSGPQPPVFQS